MQEQKQSKKNGDKIALKTLIAKTISDHKEISEQIKRDTSRLDADPLEEIKKKMQKIYMWVWILLGISALLLIVILLTR